MNAQVICACCLLTFSACHFALLILWSLTSVYRWIVDGGPLGVSEVNAPLMLSLTCARMKERDNLADQSPSPSLER